MRLSILAVGRAKAGPERDLYRHYVGRITWPLSLSEVEEKRRLSPAEMKKSEAQLLLAALPKDAALWALDLRGKALTSQEFAARIARERDNGTAVLAFAIGGAEGLADEVLQRSRLTLALGRLTWPHMLARAMLAEQLYRAQQIIAGHPYHRG
jgi:23S rRNA (pseudouridine1915-N3)-methyltransferase